MQHMDLVAMAMPSTGAWGPMDLLLVFAMWAVMMVAMMVPSATPMLLAAGGTLYALGNWPNFSMQRFNAPCPR